MADYAVLIALFVGGVLGALIAFTTTKKESEDNNIKSDVRTKSTI